MNRRSALFACALLAVATSAGAQLVAAPPVVAPKATPAGEVRAADRAERRVSPSGSATITLLARGDNAFVGRLELAPGAKVPSHRDSTEEYIHVLQGAGTLVMDGKSYAVAAGSTIYMPANAEVSFANGDAPMVGIQVFAGPEPADKYAKWTVTQK